MFIKSLFICLYFLCLSVIPVSAASSDKENVPYEVTSIQAREDGFYVNGWAALSHNQHFTKDNHHYELILSSDDHRLSYISSPVYYDHTETMMQFDTRKCRSNEYFKDASICYYEYTYTGFEFMIPYDDLLKDKFYETKLTIDAYDTNTQLSTSLFYPTLKPVVHETDELEYKAESNLYDTSLTVVYENVLERILPLKNGPYRESETYCSATYGHRIYYDVYSDFKHVYDRIQSEGTTYYKVMTSASTACKSGQNRSIEGSDRYSWIAGNFVDYTGIPLSITVKDKNTPPVLTIHQNPIIKQGWSIDPFDYVSAYDKEDGDISHKIEWIEGSIGKKIGIYELTFRIKDSKGLEDIKTMTVQIIKGNTPPIISASDKIVYQYTYFDYTKNITVFDIEDGRTIKGIWYDGEVDVEELGVYTVTYYCEDSEGMMASKSITVEVIRNPNEKIRYLDHDKIWYHQSIPRNWIYKYPYLYEQIDTPRLWEYIEFNL